MPPVVTAQFEGRCAQCDGIIVPGQRIENTTGGWAHEDCPADAPDPDNFVDLDDPDVGDR